MAGPLLRALTHSRRRRRGLSGALDEQFRVWEERLDGTPDWVADYCTASGRPRRGAEGYKVVARGSGRRRARRRGVEWRGGGSGRFRWEPGAARGDETRRREDDDREAWKGWGARSAGAAPSDLAPGGRDLRRWAR